MNTQVHTFNKLIVVAVTYLALSACSTPLTKPEGADTARSRLTQLQSDPQLASLAPVEIKNAEIAVQAAEQPQADKALATHLVIMADRKVDIALARAQSRLYEDQRKFLSAQSEAARLDSRTREANRARRDADSSRMAANIARNEAADARSEAADARSETEAARRQADELKQQIVELNARETDRGLVMTLGDVLFETGRSDLKGGTTSNLDKLVTFLNKYDDRTVVIEGHTDNVGSENSNFSLSQRRADSVKSYLVEQGIRSTRLSTSGMGEGSPVSGNDTDTGRQQNRRVEVIISNTTASLR